MLPAHVTPSEWILSGFIAGLYLLWVLAGARPRRRDREPDSSDEEDPDLPLAA